MTVQEFYPTFLNYPEICTDSRQAKSGSLFFALRGEAFDGNRFAEAALEKGCEVAVVDDPALKNKKHMVLVDDVLSFLQQLARFHRDQFNIPVIALTGTNGKTTTKELIAAVLMKQYQVLYTQGNLNNHIGVPLTLLRLNHQHEIALIEMGANHVGEIEALCKLANPNHGLITNIGKAHLEGFGSFQGVITAKTELYRHLIAVQGQIYVNEEDTLLTDQLGGYPATPYGKTLLRVKLNHDFRLSFTFHPQHAPDEIAVPTALVGPYNLPNALAALTVGHAFEIDWACGAEALGEYQPGNHRSQWMETGRNQLIMDAYNANLSSMRLVFEMFSQLQADRKLAILGEMRELGAYSGEAHQEILDLVLASGIKTWLVGPEFIEIAGGSGIEAFETVDELIAHLGQEPPRDATILLKGSRGNKLEKLLPYL